MTARARPPGAFAPDPVVYATLVALARDVASRGLHAGSRTLWEVCRYGLLGTPAGDALDDASLPAYVRLIMERERDLDGFFKTRAPAGAGRKAR